ncbi:MAG: DUF4430 domain-containing protein [Lachnospiraceae bacterium]|nr:DUF4430 domain-containing protein [Lachnospiraceae bacterium]
MTQTKKDNKKIVIGVAVLAALVILMGIVYAFFGPKPVKGAKTITIEVIDNEQNSTVYTVNTDAEYLRQAMEEAEGLEFSGTESEYGIMLDTVNGLHADFDTDGAYWSIMVNGEYGMYGADFQPVADGDAYQLVYVTYSE